MACLLLAVSASILLPPGPALAVVLAVLVAAASGLLLLGARSWPPLRRAALLREAVERTTLRYAVFARDRTLLDHSPACDLPGIGPRPVPSGMRLDDLLVLAHGRCPGGADEITRQLAAHEDDKQSEYDRTLADGSVLRVSKRRLSGGEVARFAQDVTEARTIFDSVPAGIWHLDADGRTLAGNQRLADLFGGQLPATLLGSGLYQLGPPTKCGPFGLPPGREVEGVLPALAGMPERRVILTSSSWFPGESGANQAMLTLLDVSRLHAAQIQAAHCATHDPLTGLPNRFQFQQALAELAAAPKGGTLLLLDLAGVRAVNDGLGQAAGDALLREAARRMASQTRPGDRVFRIGGDEFAVIASDVQTPDAAAAIARCVRRALAAPLDLGGSITTIRASIGHAQAPKDARDPNALHRAAALALAQAKREGSDVTTPYTHGLGERVARRLALRGQLVDAVAKGGFQLVWQPQVDARTRKLRGAEALLRWPGGPGGNAVSPAEFLPEANEAGLMPAIDAWVLDTALRQKRAWAICGGGPDVVGVNISPATLRDPGFPAQVVASLARHNVQPEALEVEIPEDVAARDLDAIAPVLHELIGEGVRLSLDDFGGGSSAIAHLLRLPVEQVKLDRSIVAGLPGGARERAILRAVAALAQGMEIPLLAEGVETEGQVEALLQEGCTVMQGWLFGRAVPADELVPPPGPPCPSVAAP
jgi:diguanylate cyclase (GGDEF)-like protein